jgi:methionyl-tRNA formyltransferase
VIITNTKITVAIFSNNYGRIYSVLSALASICKDNISIKIYTTEEKFSSFSQELREGNWSVDLKIYTNNSLFLSEYQSCGHTLGIIAGFNKILPESLIANTALGIINLHAGRLPQYRGGSPLNWQIINGENLIGVTIHMIDGGIDTGPILASRSFYLESNEGIKEAHQKANLLFLSLLKETLPVLLNDSGDITKLEQNKNDACYWHQRTSSDGKISWNYMSAYEVLNLVRGLGGGLYPPAYSESINGTVKIIKALAPSLKIKGTPGRVLYLNKIGPYVICKDEAILLQEYSTENNFALTSKLTLF